MVARAEKKESGHEGKNTFFCLNLPWVEGGKKGMSKKGGGEKVKKDFFWPGFLHVPLLAHSLEKFLALASGLMNTASEVPGKKTE